MRCSMRCRCSSRRKQSGSSASRRRTRRRLARELPAAEICATLARHGVSCVADHVRPKAAAEAGAELLAQVGKHDCDLLVMGCYGHSRLREFILGGATRHVLQHATVPVLMSH
ncbi:MAG: universal stress protein [Sphingomonadales bacterium]|nr:universal stress protein [Sphingomonadales bacterium]